MLSSSTFLVLMLIPAISTNQEPLRQTIPENKAVCPGQKLQYTCTYPNTELSWTIGSSQPVTFNKNNVVNSGAAISGFSLLLSSRSATSISSTATHSMVTSEYDGQAITCYSGQVINSLTIAVADGPDDCSSTSVIPECLATTSGADDTEIEFLITLSTTNKLMCVDRYRVQFNGRSETVPIGSPSARFLISEADQPVSNEIVVHTLDYENRTGQVPCTFSIPAPQAVESIELHWPVCDAMMNDNQNVVIRWEPAVVEGCLGSRAPLLYIIEFSDSQFLNGTTTSTSYSLTNVKQGTDLEITITPTLPFMELTGPPFSRTVNLNHSTRCVDSGYWPHGDWKLSFSFVVLSLYLYC